jgi:hypothetical protein
MLRFFFEINSNTQLGTDNRYSHLQTGQFKFRKYQLTQKINYSFRIKLKGMGNGNVAFNISKTR